MITMDVADGLVSLVKATIDIDKYPEVKILNRGHKVFVQGEISDIDSSLSIVQLKNATFRFE